MKLRNALYILAIALFAAASPTLAYAEEYTHCTPGVSGYDPVAYFTEDKAVEGNGWHASEVDGVIYVFSGEKHKEMFDDNPEKYLPAYNGYCAYGVAVGKKFVADPEVWKIVEGKLYLNLDEKIQKKWAEDIPGYIKKADDKWPEIRGKAPSDL